MHSLSIAFKTQKLLIEPAKAEAYLKRVEDVDISRIAGDLEETLSMMFGSPPVMIKSAGLAIIPVKGVIGAGLTRLEQMMGCIDVELVEEMIEEAHRDPGVQTIIFDFDTPGGTVTGVPELAKRIRSCSKRTIGWTGRQCCSAGYWLMSQCDETYSSPSAVVGSVGVYVPIIDVSAAYKHEGVAVDVIKSGWAKAAGYPGTTLTPEQRRLFEESCFEDHNWFIGDIKSVRVYAKDEDMQGQCWSGKKAAEKMLVDGLFNTFDDVLNHISAEVYENYERQEPSPAVATPASARADVQPYQGDDEDGTKPVVGDKKKKKKKKSDGEEDDLEEEIEPEMPDLPGEETPPVETDCKPKS